MSEAYIPTPEDIQRVKGLGCLRDKRYPDRFNVRVITRNGKITTAEQRAIADAADKFGSGEVAMTTRQTIEIQGIAYDQIENLIAFLGEHGLEIGGTGPRVRPIVSCKGTTCQYGLCDTYGLSEDANCIVITALLVCSNELDEELVYNMTKALYEQEGILTHAKAAEITLDTAFVGVGELPLHPGAARYYAEVGAAK